MTSTNDTNKALKTFANASGDLTKLHDELHPSSNRWPSVDSEVSLQVASIWKETLGLVDVDPDADFFELGGTSILAVQMLYQIRKQVHKDLSFVDLVENRITVKEIVAKLSVLPNA
jgi:hypothetical protein